MSLKNIFLNPFGRIRSGWRFLAFFLSFILLSGFLGAAEIALLLRLSPTLIEDSLVSFAAPFLLFTIIAVFLGWFYGKIFEGLPFRALGCWFTKNWLKDLFLGFGLGAFSICFAAFLPMIVGGLSFQFNRTASTSEILLTLSSSLIVFIIGAMFEETVFRGYMLQTFSRAKLLFVGCLLTSLLFASAHNNNQGANFFSWLNTFLAGIWLAVAYFKTRTLWMPFGLHVMWNWFQGSILGINVSGITKLTPAPLFQAVDIGPTWLTGGHYGIEGGFACTTALIFSTILILFLPVLKPTAEMLALTNQELRVESQVREGESDESTLSIDS